MRTNTIKDIWQSSVHIKSYSDSELNDIIIKSARKSMKAIQLGGIFQLVIIVIMIYLVFILVFRNNGLEMKLLNSAGLLILLVCSLLWKRSDYKMNKYKYDMPIKEWLEYRIHELNKTICMRKRYKVLVLCITIIIGFGVHVVTQIIQKTPFNPLVSGSIFIGLIIYIVIVSASLDKKHKKTLKELQELYGQVEESLIKRTNL